MRQLRSKRSREKKRLLYETNVTRLKRRIIRGERHGYLIPFIIIKTTKINIKEWRYIGERKLRDWLQKGEIKLWIAMGVNNPDCI